MGKTINMLAFDFGASSGRAILGGFDGEKISFEEIHRFPNEPVWVNKSFYWDILRLWIEVKTGLQKALAQGIEIHSIGVDTWGVDYGLLDKKGQLLANPHHYRDQRTVPVMNDLVGRLGGDYLYERTGIQFMSFNTLFQLGAEVKENPHLIELTDKVLLMPDLFNYLLTGEKAAEYSIASTTQFMNIKTKTWDTEILKEIGMPVDKLPPIIPPGTRLGRLTNELCQELGCQPIPVIAVAGHDTQSAIAAAPIADENEGYISSGTWSLMGSERKEPVVTPQSRQSEFTNEGGFNYTVTFFKNINALWFIQECRRIWRMKDPNLSFNMIAGAAAQAQPFKMLINVSDQRFFAPHDMVNEIEQYCKDSGQAVPADMGEVARAIYESLALEYRSVADRLRELTGTPMKVLHIVGGGSKDDFLSQLTADAMKIPVTAGPIEATALGNLMVQAMSAGAIGNLEQGREIIRRSNPVEEYKPRQVQGWDEAYQRYLKLTGR